MPNQKMEQKDRLREFFLSAVSEASVLDSMLENLDYYNIKYRAIRENRYFKMLNCDLCLYKYKYKDEDCIILIYSIPSPSNPEAKEDSRHLSQKVMELLKIIEDCFITVDYIDLKDVIEDKFNYLVVIKRINPENEEQ